MSFGFRFKVQNSIIAGNTASVGPDLHSGFDSFGYNIIGNTADTNGSLPTTGDQFDVDPLVGALTDNGGTTLTHALLPGSPAIDQGKSANYPTDQRGRVRPFDNAGIGNASGGDGSDVGAFELNALLPIVPRVEFTGDGKSDILWQNNVTGQRAVWVMNGTQLVQGRFLPTVATQWQIATSADFNADGQTDLVWQNTSTGQRAIWIMNGTSLVVAQFLPTVATAWQIVGSGDFSGDGKPDLVWQNTNTGQRAIWT